MKVIAVSGWKQSGKDTIADYLVYKYNFEKFKFADKLKDIVSEQYGINRLILDDNVLKDKPILDYPVINCDKFATLIHEFMKDEFINIEGRLYWTPRALCIIEGSIKRSINPNYWVFKVVNSIIEKDIKLNSENRELFAVIADLRYKSEVDLLKNSFNSDLITIRVNRFDTISTNDPSERDLDDYCFDFVVENKGTFEELYNKIDNIIIKIVGN